MSNVSVVEFNKAHDGTKQKDLKVAPFEAGEINLANEIIAIRSELIQAKQQALIAIINKTDHSSVSYAAERKNKKNEFATKFGEEMFKPALPPLMYWVVVIIMFAVELPLNKGAIDFLQYSENEAYVIAVWLGITGFLAGKTVARIVRQARWSDYKLNALLFLSIASFAFVYCKLGYVRDLDALSNSGITLPPFLSSTMLILPFLVSILISFFQIDPILEREQLLNRVNFLDNKIDQLWQKRIIYTSQYNYLRSKGQALRARIIARIKAGIYQYRDSNRRWRVTFGKTGAPEFFQHPITDNLFLNPDFGVTLDTVPNAASSNSEIFVTQQ